MATTNGTNGTNGTHDTSIPPPGTSKHTPGEFRTYLPDLTTPRFTTLNKHTAYDHVDMLKKTKNPPWLHALYDHWRKLFADPYRGVTTDGTVRPGLFPLQDEGVPVGDIVSATNKFFSLLDDTQRSAVLFHIDSPEWRSWSNPEFYFSQKGVRLDETSAEVRKAALAVLEATLSPEGYQKALSAMRVNHFLGEICKCPRVMNEFSYNLVFFGTPAVDTPWGFSWYGHHLCLNIFLYKNQIVVSPWFTGAEPNEIDEGPHAGTRLMQTEEELALRLMQSLPAATQQKVQTYKLMKDPAMPHGRWSHDDQRHLCGAYRDNRIVPNEGVAVSTFTPEQQALVWAICEQYLLYLPRQARGVKLGHCKSFVDETYFCWIGGFGEADPFYFRIQSPVIIVEFDHHSGVFLSNREPAKFHIHTLLRTPNAGDYGMALRPLIPGDPDWFCWQPAEGESDR